MATNNQYDVNMTRYTHRDYDSIKEDLINAIPSLTQEWTSTAESDPGIVLIKLMAMFGDTLSYNIDKIALELYMQTVTQRKNCAKVLELLGYKMHWYRSAKVLAQVKFNTSTGNPYRDNNYIIIHPYETVFTANDINYAYVDTDYGDLYINGGNITSPSVSVKLVQGTPTSETFNDSALTNNKYYLKTSNVDESHLRLLVGRVSGNGTVSPNNSTSAILVDNIYLAPGGPHVYFSFNIDEYNQPYIQLSENWRSVVTTGETIRFTLTYLVSSGSKGNISENAFTGVKNISGSNEGIPSFTSLLVNNFANNSDNYQGVYNSSGKDPQSVEEAKKDAANYVFTHDTLVTASDYEKASKRLEDITVSKLVDGQVIVNDQLDSAGIINRCNDNFGDPTNPLSAYLAILYLAYKNFNVEDNDYYLNGRNYQLDPDDPYGSDYAGNTYMENLGFYPYKISDKLVIAEQELLANLNILNVDLEYGTLKLFPFRVMGKLNLVQPLSPQDTLQVIQNVDDALSRAYYPDLHPIGEKPNFIELVDIIQDADNRIKYFDAVGNIVEWAPLINTTPIPYDEVTDEPNPQEDPWDTSLVYKYVGETTLDYTHNYIYSYSSGNWVGVYDNYIDSIFDTTSAIMYNGLSKENFTLNDKYSIFKFKNVAAQVDAQTAANLLLPQTENQINDEALEDYGVAYLFHLYTVKMGREPTSFDELRETGYTVPLYTTYTVQCNSTAELEALCKDLTYSGLLVIGGDPHIINNTGLQYVGG